MPAVFGPSTFFSASMSMSPIGLRRNLAHGAAAHRCRRRIGAVRGVGHDDLGALAIAAMAVIRHDHRHAGELALRAGHRRERHAAFHAGHVGEDFLQARTCTKENPALSDSGAYGWRARNPSSIASELHARGLYFIVHEPSG